MCTSKIWKQIMCSLIGDWMKNICNINACTTQWNTTQSEKGISSVSSVAQLCPTLCDPWTAARQASLSITNSQSPPKPMSIVLVMPSNHLILCHPLVLLPSIFPSIRLFSHESALHIRWPSIGVQSIRVLEHPGLIFRMDWLDLLAVQGTLRVFSNTTVQKHQFFCTQLSL